VDDAKMVLLLMNSGINQLPEDERCKVMACAERLRQLIKEYGEAGNYALGPHHWQHWIFADGFSPKGSSVESGVMEMPAIYVREMVADWMGASRVYTGSWDMTAWLATNLPKVRLHSRAWVTLKGILGEESVGYQSVLDELQGKGLIP